MWVHRLGGGVRQVVLATYVGIEGTSLVRLLDELSSVGLVIRKDDPSDRRAKTIWLTEEGERLAEQVETVLRDLRDRVLEDVDIADIDATLRVCDAIERSAALACSGSLSILDGNVLVTDGTIGSAGAKMDDCDVLEASRK